MKKLFVLLTIFILFMSCSANKSKSWNDPIQKIELETFSRAYQNLIIVNPKTIVQKSKKEKIQSKLISANQWNELANLLYAIPKNEISTLESNDKGFNSDRGQAERLTIYLKKSGTITTPDYDAKNPPEILEDLLNLIAELK